MKNIVLVAIILALSVGMLVAQPVFGARLGLNMANISQKDIEKNTSKMGLNIGGMMQYPIAENIVFQPELLYTMKGANFDYNANPYWSFGYIEIPMLVKYNVNMPSMKIQPYLGPSLAMLMSAKSGNDDTDTDVKDDMEGMEFGLNLGADVIFMKSYMAGLRYDMGLSNIMKDAPTDYEVYNRTIMVNVGYIFGQKD